MLEKKSGTKLAHSIPMLSDHEMEIFRDLIYEECGIQLKEAKRSMMSSRLFKRLRALGMDSYQDYYDHLHNAENSINEIVSLINVITTNKTDFFREPIHFDLLKNTVLPQLLSDPAFSKKRKVDFWSAGCSSGQEPYTLAMVLKEYFNDHSGDFSILATDISSKVLMEAKKAVYTKDVVIPIPGLYKNKYLMTGTGKCSGLFRVKPELRNKIRFGRLNFMDDNYGIDTEMDVVFCRNVIIYFDWQTKIDVITKLFKQLRVGGYLFVGHSETLNGVNLPLKKVIPTVFQKIG